MTRLRACLSIDPDLFLNFLGYSGPAIDFSTCFKGRVIEIAAILNDKSLLPSIVSLSRGSKGTTVFSSSDISVTLTFGGSRLISRVFEIVFIDTSRIRSLYTLFNDTVPLFLRLVIISGDELVEGIVSDVGRR